MNTARFDTVFSLILTACCAHPKSVQSEFENTPTDPCNIVLQRREDADPLDTDKGCPFKDNPSPGCPQISPAKFANCSGMPVLSPRDIERVADKNEVFLQAVIMESYSSKEEPDQRLVNLSSFCHEVLTSEPIISTLRRIATEPDEMILRKWPHAWPLDDVKRGFAAVFSHLQGWDYCDQIRYGDDGVKLIHGEFDPQKWRISLYRSSCTAVTIYDTSLQGLNTVSRFNLVMAHELGHVIDALDGGLNDPMRCATREERATLYGTFIARCYGQLMKLVVVSGISLEESQSSHDPRASACLAERYDRFDQMLASITSRVSSEGADPQMGIKKVPSALGQVIGCLGH